MSWIYQAVFAFIRFDVSKNLQSVRIERFVVSRERDAATWTDDMLKFDPGSIGEEGIRREFQFLARRTGQMSLSLCHAYGLGRKRISFRYVNGFEFNAFAGLDDDAYQIELNASVPLFSILLFSRLLSQPTVLPFLDASGHRVSSFSVPIVVDPADFQRRANWDIELTEIRSFAAGTIGGLCSTFVLCHEFGHILSGHVEGMQHYFGRNRLPELVSKSRQRVSYQELRQAWEYEADRVASLLVVQFVEELVVDREKFERTALVFSDEGGFHFEHTLAIAVVALFCFFTYVQAMRMKLNKFSSHPHPHVRATYMKHALLQAAKARRPIDGAIFHQRLDARLEEALDALEVAGLLEPRRYTRKFMNDVDKEIDRIETAYQRHRDKCNAWRWIDLN